MLKIKGPTMFLGLEIENFQFQAFFELNTHRFAKPLDRKFLKFFVMGLNKHINQYNKVKYKNKIKINIKIKIKLS